jgi:DNA-binding CsgD family transcriptional regulator
MEPRVAYARTSDGVEIAHHVLGAGPWLVLMPGVPFSFFMQEWQIAPQRELLIWLSRFVTVVQYDGRGTGLSQRDVADLSVAAMVRDLEAVVERLGIEDFGLFGFYNSCLGAIAYAAKHNRDLRGLFLWGAATQGSKEMGTERTQAVLSLIERDWDLFAETAAHAWSGWGSAIASRVADVFRQATTPAVARATLVAAAGADIGPFLEQVSTRTLVFHRAAQTQPPLEVSREVASRLPNGRLVVLEGDVPSHHVGDASIAFELAVEQLTGVRPEPAQRAPVSDLQPSVHPSILTAREREVLGWVARGDTNAEIAYRLGVTIHTIERHLVNSYRKIDVRGRAEAAAYAVREGLA